jgi:hypothetical protein
MSPAWLRAACLNTAQVTCRDIGVERQNQLTDASKDAPPAQQSEAAAEEIMVDYKKNRSPSATSCITIPAKSRCE